MEKLTPIFGWAGLTVGLFVAICAPLPGYGAPLAMMGMLPGFLLSSLYVLYSTKYRISYGWFNPGYVGMLLSSTPLMMIVYFKLLK